MFVADLRKKNKRKIGRVEKRERKKNASSVVT
jgi:hypothetical protein